MNITNVITVLHVWVTCIVTSLPAVRFTTSAQARLPWAVTGIFLDQSQSWSVVMLYYMPIWAPRTTLIEPFTC